MREKITTRIDLHLTETMKADLLDLALKEDRKVSDLVRHIVACYLYGHKTSCVQDALTVAGCGE